MSKLLFKFENWNRIDDLDATIYVWKSWIPGALWARAVCWPPYGRGPWPKSYRRLVFGGVDKAKQVGYDLADKWRAQR